METLEIMMKDPPSWAAAAVFLAGLTAFFWSLAGLKARAASFPPLPAVGEPTPPAGDKRPAKPHPDMDATVNISAPPAPATPTVSLAAFNAVEEKFSELAKRVNVLEHPKPGQVPAYLDPLLKRVQDLEGEFKGLKFAFTQLAAAQNNINIGDITAKIHSIQKLLETLTGGTDVSKPS